MKMKEQFKMWAFLLALPLAFAACDDDDTPDGGMPVTAEKGVFVFNAGNQGSSIEGSLSFIDRKNGTVTNDAFKSVNGRSLGSTVQDGVVLGNNLYIAVSESNTIEVVDKNTLVSIVQIKPDEEQGSQPRDIVTDGKYVYVSMYSGHVSRINSETNRIDKTVKVGPNPEEMAIANNFLYVANSDGLNYEADYANGKSVSKVSLSSFEEEAKIAVGMNPTKVAADASGNILVLCTGNYATIAASIWRINSVDEAEDLGISASFMVAQENSLYTVYDAYAGADAVKYTVYNTLTGAVEKENFVSVPVDSPAGIAVDSKGNIFITSYNLVGGFASYNTPGYVNEYSSDGTFVKKYDVGVGAVYMTFLN
ncbi:DUF5074 domain-containing protein [uncultured Bacteroides sp.]|jgi:hypothetical protein|uniref:DUF5074 domain-containing protein n=1 Tax=uncultured Bacteroides sp. TaxID=162156 RepID=UPI00280AAA41|nr:DUF5074 domain-containing protein [uncultured Bacteroides sp.]